MKKYLHILIICIRVLLIMAALSLFYYLLSQDLAFSGSLSDANAFQRRSPLVLKLIPDAHVLPVMQDEQGVFFQRIVSSPVYFEVNMPRLFSSVTVELKYKNESQERVDIGIKNGPGEDYAIKPIENKKIDALTWSSFIEHDVVLYQKEQIYSSVNEFSERLQPRNTLSYFYDISQVKVLDESTDLSKYSFLITPYTSPKKENEMIHTSTTFDLSVANVNARQRIQFMISAPNLQNQKNTIDMYEMKVTFHDIVLEENSVLQKIYPYIKMPYDLFFE